MRRLVVSLEDRRPVRRAPPGVAESLRAELPSGWEMVEVRTPADGRGDGGAPSAEALRAVRGAEVYVGPGFPRPLFRAATAASDSRLRWVHSLSAGVGEVLYPEMVDSEVVLTNSAGIYARPMADSALAMILHFARGLDVAVRAQSARRWEKSIFEEDDSPLREVAGATVGILGYGGTGREVARRALALGMRVVALRRTPGAAEAGVELLHGEGGLPRLLRASDYLVVLVPETAETRGMLGAPELALLPAGAVVVNLARGAVIEEEALIDALRAGRLRGAGLDVFREEPLPESSPLWSLPDVLVTPHVSGISPRYWEREGELLRENLRRYLTGQPLLNRVEKRRGY
jgi:phosphoglycerate dehydrogenase-like enzyme